MTMAVQRVLTTPELLEQILLSIKDEEGRFCEPCYFFRANDDILVRRRLFVLQRVSCSFASTIRGSSKLRSRMGLDYKLQGKVLATEEEINDNDDDDDDETLSLLLYHLGPGLAFGHTFDVSVTLELTIYITINPALQSCIVTENYTDACIVTNKPYRMADPGPQSWRNATISTVRVPTSAKIHIRVQDSDFPATNLVYSECLHFAAGEGTLGDVADLIRKIERRSLAQHRLSAACDELILSARSSVDTAGIGS